MMVGLISSIWMKSRKEMEKMSEKPKYFIRKKPKKFNMQEIYTSVSKPYTPSEHDIDYIKEEDYYDYD